MSASAGRRPNYLLFITDQHRADHLGAYGNRVVKTPRLDQLAAGGWTADRCYVASPICMPNRASLMTGRMPSVHGARHNGVPLPLDQTTFVERLREAGWRTALVGKSHLQNITGQPALYPRTDSPRTEGEARRIPEGRYDQEDGVRWSRDTAHDVDTPFYGYETVDLVINHGDTAQGHYRRWLEREHPEVAKLTGIAQAIPAPGFELVRSEQAWRSRVPESLSTTAWIGDRTIAHIERFARAGENFFLQCSFPDPHHPFTPPGRFWDMHSPDEIELPASFRADATGPVPHLDWLHAQRDAGKAVKHTPAMFAATEREVREAIALNYGSIAQIDQTIGRVLDALARCGLERDTVIIFTADHGDYFGDHQLLWKGPLHYQGLIRVPLIWNDPAVASGARSSALCSTIDLAPSILERAGLSPPNGVQGRSMLPVMADPSARWRDSLLIEEEGQRVMFGFGSRTRMRSLQTDRYRLSVYDGATWGELYDLEHDPLECHNLWESSEHAALRHDLMHRLLKQMIAHAEESPAPSAIA